MATRFTFNKIVTTSTSNFDSLSQLIEQRGLKNISHYTTSTLIYPTAEQINRLVIQQHTWKGGDKFWKLSATYYGDPKYWWIIAWYNRKPIEATINVGDIIEIPQPLSDLLGFIT